MATEKGKVKGVGEFVTIGDVKAPRKVWGLVNTYKVREQAGGRKLNLPDAFVELAEIGAKQEGIK